MDQRLDSPHPNSDWNQPKKKETPCNPILPTPNPMVSPEIYLFIYLIHTHKLRADYIIKIMKT